MLYQGAAGRSLVSEDFNRLCTENRIEARVQAFPNPGNPLRAMRLITFTNFNNTSMTIVQQDRRKKRHLLPAKGTLEVLLAPDEPMPEIEKGI
jgi:hypothetical protein